MHPDTEASDHRRHPGKQDSCRKQAVDRGTHAGECSRTLPHCQASTERCTAGVAIGLFGDEELVEQAPLRAVSALRDADEDGGQRCGQGALREEIDDLLGDFFGFAF